MRVLFVGDCRRHTVGLSGLDTSGTPFPSHPQLSKVKVVDLSFLFLQCFREPDSLQCTGLPPPPECMFSGQETTTYWVYL